MDWLEILNDPEWLPHRYDEASDSFRFVPVTRVQHRKAVFLTDENLEGAEQFVAIPRAAIDLSRLTTAPIHFVFHSAYCCSTLVARMFDVEGVSMGLKEPVLLNDVVGLRRRGADSKLLTSVLDTSLALLSRPFGAGESVVIKPSSILNPIALAILAVRPDARAIQLYAPLEDFLSSIAAKGLWGRQWVRKALIGQAQDNALSHRFNTGELLELTDLQAAGLGWLSHHAAFARVRERFGRERVAICDSETLLSDPQATVRRFFDQFGVGLDAARVREITGGEAFTRNSKDRGTYSASDRRERLDATFESNREEITMVSEWVRRMAADIGLDVAPEPSLEIV